MLLVLALVVGLVVAEPTTAPPAAAEGQSLTGVVLVDGTVRNYLLHLPPGWTPGRRVPLVVGLHGAGSFALHFATYSGLDEEVASRGWVTVYPQGTSVADGYRTWNAGLCCPPSSDFDVDDVAFIEALLDQLELTLAIDPRRIYVTGHSNGGMLAYKLGCELPGRIAAIAPVASAIDDTAPCTPRHPLSVIAVHGRRIGTCPTAAA